MQTFQYGSSDAQQGDLHLPEGVAKPPVVCLLHGGFWRMPYGRAHWILCRWPYRTFAKGQ